MDPQSDSEFFTPQELSSYLRMSLKWVEKHTQRRCIPGQVKMGRVWRYSRLEVLKRLATGQFLLPGGHNKRARPC